MFSKIFANFGVSMLTHSALQHLFRSSPSEVFLGKGVLKICSKLTGEHPCRSTTSIKLLCNFIEVALRHGCSSVNLLHIFRTPFLKNTSEGLLLPIIIFFSFFHSFFGKTAEGFSTSVQYVAGWSAEIQDRNCFHGHTSKFAFVDSVNFWPKCVGLAQTLKHTHDTCSYVASTWARQQYGSEEYS